MCLPLFVTGAALVLNGALDTSPEQTDLYRVISVRPEEDSVSRLHVRSADAHDLRRSDTFVAAAVDTTDHVAVRWRAGALGWRWESGPATLAR